MKQVLVMGAGMVARPLVTYLLEREDFALTVADIDGARARAVVAGHERGTALAVDGRDIVAVERLLEGAELCVGILPPEYEPPVARAALAKGVHYVSASPLHQTGLAGLDETVRAAGLTFLPECGLDPGIDHMVIARLARRIEAHGGVVTACRSYCGGLPAPEARNCWDYKFSWNPRGAVNGARQPARYLEDGEEKLLPGEELFTHHWPLAVPGFEELEAHYNGDSVPYLQFYNLPGARTMVRATLRYPGWSFTMSKLGLLGYLDDVPLESPPATYAGLTRRLSGISGDADLLSGLAQLLDVAARSSVMTRIEWLGLTADQPLSWSAGQARTPREALANKMRERMMFAPGERDVCVMHNELDAQYPSRERERRSATLVAYGEAGGDSAMARTVGIPAAIAASLILDGRISERGVVLPVISSVFDPILDGLAERGIAFVEKTEPLRPSAAPTNA